MWRRWLLVLVVFGGSVLTLGSVVEPKLLDWLADAAEGNYWWLILVLLIGKVMVLYPPLPGVVLTLAAVPILGWQKAYMVEFVGSALGATLSFYGGQRFGWKFLLWLLGEEYVRKLQRIRVKDERQIETTFVLRALAGGALSDGLAWGASLLGLRLRPFLVGYLLSHMATTMPIFFLLGLSVRVQTWLIALPVILVSWVLLWRFKGRYLE